MPKLPARSSAAYVPMYRVIGIDFFGERQDRQFGSFMRAVIYARSLARDSQGLVTLYVLDSERFVLFGRNYTMRCGIERRDADGKLVLSVDLPAAVVDHIALLLELGNF